MKKLATLVVQLRKLGAYEEAQALQDLIAQTLPPSESTIDYELIFKNTDLSKNIYGMNGSLLEDMEWKFFISSVIYFMTKQEILGDQNSYALFHWYHYHNRIRM